jgi:nucleotidyltransferase/DNA polymerase involved in DNA repair
MRGGSARLLSPVQANHRLYIDYHERILKAVDTCLPVEKVCSIDEMACRLMGTERQVPIARELALNVKRALREQVGDCLTCSIGLAPNVFLGKVGSDIQKPDGLVVITKNNLPDILLGLELQDIYGIGERMEERLHRVGIFTVAEPLERDAVPVAPRVGRHQRVAVPPDAARRRHPAAGVAFFKEHRPPACAGAGIAQQQGRA